MPTPPARSGRPSDATSERLINAAAREFNEHGFGGTDTNKIARRAGFAPQTFYRWFDGKAEIFIETYERWRRQQFEELSELMAKNASDARVAEAVVAHHRRHLVFRRSLRHLSVENAVIRAARATGRLQQIEFVKSLNPGHARDGARIATLLLQTERLADALAEEELQDMGLDMDACLQALARLIHELRNP